MHNALHHSSYSQAMRSKCQDDSVAMTTAGSASEPRLGPDGLLRRERHQFRSGDEEACWRSMSLL